MAASLSSSNLKLANIKFNEMLKRFAIVTVMNAKVYNIPENFVFSDKKVDAIVKEIVKDEPVCTLDTLKIANVTINGPDKTVTGGRYSNPLVKFGKSARLEIQDALGNAQAIEALCGGLIETFKDGGDNSNVLHITENFSGPIAIIGETFFIDQKSGFQIKANIIFYQVLPDSLFNLSQDSEGDATVFDMNADLLTTEITIGTDDTEETDIVNGVFYSIYSPVFIPSKDSGSSGVGPTSVGY